MFHVLVFVVPILVWAQDGIRNTGGLRIDDQGGLGLHTNLVNDAIFDENQGLVGFYGEETLTVSGLFIPTFQDIEFLTPQGLVLETPINVANNANFILGDIITFRSPFNEGLRFLDDGSFFNGVGDLSKVNGYCSIENQRNFMFPVGDSEELRPLLLNSQAPNSVARCTYIRGQDHYLFASEVRLGSQYFEPALSGVSFREFWHLETQTPSTIEITWNQNSWVAQFATDINQISIVGWHLGNARWEAISSVAQGDLEQGILTSDEFQPNEYALISIGALYEPSDAIFQLPNYFVSPNNDGINDFFQITDIDPTLTQKVKIYNRAGLLVYESDDYQGDFNGFSNQIVPVDYATGLPRGIYFYLVTVEETGFEYQGFLYLKTAL